MLASFFRHRPAVMTALCLMLGILAEDEYLHPVGALNVICVAAAVLVLGLVVILVRQPRSVGLVALIAALIGLGGLLTSTEPGEGAKSSLEKLASYHVPQVIVAGTLAERTETGDQEQWIVAVDSVGFPRSSRIAMDGRLLLRIDALQRHRFGFPPEGSTLRIYCQIEPFHEPSNPYESPAERHTQQLTGCDAQGYIRSIYDVYLIQRGSGESPVKRFVQSTRSGILSLIDSAVADIPTRGFIEAVVLGERSDMSPETLEDFSASGVSHILAVSGFNVAIVALVVAQLLRLFGFYWHRPRTIVSMLALLAYAAIVGFQPSVVRALIMIELLFLARLLERKPDTLNVVAGAVLIDLVIRPLDLFDVGFQLSYSAVLGLVLIAPRLQHFLIRATTAGTDQTLRDRLAGAFAMSLAASIASYPIVATHFYRISFVGLLVNLPVIPISTLITALGFLLIPLTALWQPLGVVYGEACSHVTRFLLWVVKLSAHLPHAAHNASPPGIYFVLTIFGLLIYVLHAKDRRRFAARALAASGMFTVLLVLGLPVAASVFADTSGKLEVICFDVGQGDCIFLRTPGDHRYFIDFGPASTRNVPRFDRAVLPFLRAEGLTTVDAGFISHMHKDHYAGAPSLIEQGTISTLYTSGERAADLLARAIDSGVRAKSINVRRLAQGDTVRLDSNVILYVLQPSRQAMAARGYASEKVNSGSLAFRVVYGNTSFLFLGDVERSEEEAMKACYGSFLRSDVVKVAHHGSLTSSSREFVSTVHPAFAVVSVGEHKRFGQPAPAILRRWQSVGAQVLRTDRDGAVVLVSDGRSVSRAAWR